ncbi:MAG: hypothetical protein IPN34_07620 [Planctomycetes bacterium]|nr:hypothetical protein [Planctomycetota bacterium]
MLARLLALPCAALFAVAPLAAQIGVVDQDNTSHDNVSWNMAVLDDLQQEVAVGQTGQLVGFTLKLWSQSASVGLPLALFRGNGPHPATAVPLWTGMAFAAPSASATEVYVDCSSAALLVTPSDVLTLRCGDAIAPTPGISLTGNYGLNAPFYTPFFYEQGRFEFLFRIWFRSHVLACSSGILARYGAGCPGTSGVVPELAIGGCAVRNGPVSVQITKGLGYSAGILVFGTGQINVPIGGACELWVNPFLPVQVAFAMTPGGPGTGSATLPGVLPNLPSGSFTLQAFIYEPGTATRFSTTNAVLVSIG